MLPNELQILIISYIDNINCCKLSSLHNYKCCNRFYRNIIDKSNFMKNYHYFKYDKNVINVEKLCTFCDNFNSTELNEIKYIEKEYLSYSKKKNRILLRNFFYKSDNIFDKCDFQKFIHFKDNNELKKFKNKVYNKRMNIEFGNECCGGKGCAINIRI